MIVAESHSPRAIASAKNCARRSKRYFQGMDYVLTLLALSYIHSQRPPIVHRDVKPAAVYIEDAWIAKLGCILFSISAAFILTRLSFCAKNDGWNLA